ncbi:hypothetical protein KCU85_g7882, partial [Aureobasidium melanogenum]
MKSHLGAVNIDGHNMGPYVCQRPGCNVRSTRKDLKPAHDSHPGVDSSWDIDDALAEALDAELAASERRAHQAPSAAGPAGSTTAGTGRYGPTPPYPPGPPGTLWTMAGPPHAYAAVLAVPPPSITAGSSQSTTAPTIAAAPSPTASSSTPTAPFAIHPALLAMNGTNHATPNNHNDGASTQDDNNNHNNEDQGPSSASAPLEHSAPTILAHGEDSDITNDSDDSESSREYLIRTGVAPLFMEAMKLLALTDPPVEKPLLWAGKWFEARSREIEGVDEEDGEKEDVKDGGKEKEKEDESEEKENENEGGKEDEKEPEKNDEKDSEKDDEKDVEKNIEKNIEKDDQKDVEVGGEKEAKKEAKKEDEHK